MSNNGFSLNFVSDSQTEEIVTDGNEVSDMFSDDEIIMVLCSFRTLTVKIMMTLTQAAIYVVQV